MPIVQIKIWEGRTQEQKNRIIQSVADAIVESMGVARERVTVVLQESPKGNWGIYGAPAIEATED